MDDASRLRSYLGEVIAEGETDADTMFSDEEIADILTFKGTSKNLSINLYLAAAEGWERKAARVANLITVQDGGSSRAMSDLHDHAIKEAERFMAMGLGRDFTRIGKIVRPGTTIR